jgi:hypothetical protein
MTASRFSKAEWQTLQLAAPWVLSAILGHHRTFRPQESNAFWRSVERAARLTGGLAGEVLTSIAEDPAVLFEDFPADRRPVVSGLRQVVAILDRQPAHEADAFKHAIVVHVGAEVARARGPFGESMSLEDAQTLQLLATLLEMSADVTDLLDVAS